MKGARSAYYDLQFATACCAVQEMGVVIISEKKAEEILRVLFMAMKAEEKEAEEYEGRGSGVLADPVRDRGGDIRGKRDAGMEGDRMRGIKRDNILHALNGMREWFEMQKQKDPDCTWYKSGVMVCKNAIEQILADERRIGELNLLIACFRPDEGEDEDDE